MPYTSVADMYRDRVKKTPDLEAFSYPDANEDWVRLSWKQVDGRVQRIAAGLRAIGVDDEQGCAILCGTRVEWLFADIAIMCAGGATTTVYPTSTADDTQYILEDSGCVMCFVEDQGQVDKVRSVKDQLPNVHHLVVVDGESSDDGWVVSLDELEAMGAQWAASEGNDINAVIDRITPDKLATLIYTSGTTGKPKGVELLNDCWLYIGEALESTNLMSPDDKQFLWLPLSHSFGKMLEVAVIHLGIPTAIDGRIPKIIDNLAVVRPTFMGAAPRIFEKVYNKVVNGAQEAGGLKWMIFRWAIQVGRAASKELQGGREPAGMLAFQYKIADKLVFSKLRARFGGRIRYFISGSAPLNREIAEFFHAAGLLILEGYGLTESSAASFVNRPDTNAFGTVGFPMPGTELRIEEETGEILIHSRGVMRGYYNRNEATAETLREIDGKVWLCTGDKGETDSVGRLKITDRIKNLIKTSGGKYVAPAAIEGNFKAICPLASQIVVHGNNRNFCTALITVDPEALEQWAGQNGMSGDYETLSQSDRLKQEIQGYVDQLNEPLPRYSTIKYFAVLPQDFSVETGELTPSLKVKRKVVEGKYADVLDGFYTGSIAAM